MARGALIRQVRIPSPAGELQGELALPRPATALVLFAHGSGSGRSSPRNRAVAEVLQRAGLATLLLDLLPGSPVELHQGMELCLACQSLLAAVDWASQEPTLRALPQGLFGGSTGAAVALEVAALRPERIGAVVCRGGRPDLAFEALGLVRCPTLLIVGAADVDVLELNAWAAAHLRARHDLWVVPGAGHLFSEPGALEAVAEASCRWFATQLCCC
jgi:dienelactone hydrolase